MRRANGDERGQTLVIVALMLTALFGFVGLVADIGWYELNMVRVQRAADAAALAGVVYLPGNVGGAVTAAQNEAAKNGFANGTNGVTVTAAPLTGAVLEVKISSPVRTFFARLFGVTSFTARRNARAEFVLPVPMGSPEDYYGINVLCGNTDTPPSCPQVPSATGGGNLAPLGFFGGVEARGTNRSDGDAYSTFYNGNPVLNTGFDVNGYSYIVDFPAGTTGGTVYLFDPIFCATGAGTSTGRRLGVGDYWFPSGTGGIGVSTVYNLWDMNGTPYATSDDTLLATSGALFATSNGVDKGPVYRGNQVYGPFYYGASSADCQSSPYHNRWWQLASGLTEGQYRVQAVTSSGANNENAINGFGIQVASTSGPGGRVYGQSRMAAFIAINNASVFYLAQVEASHAGKTLEIKLFDPGDITNTSLKIRVPTATGFTYATFTWTATGSSGGDDLGPDSRELHGADATGRARPGLVEDRIQHRSERSGHHDVGSERSRQPRSPHHAVLVVRIHETGGAT
jgi:hypothetical protein